MAWERIHIGNQDRPAVARRRPAHAAAQCDPNTRRTALKRTKYQRFVTQKVEPRPIQSGQRVEDRGGGVGGIRGRIGFAGEQGVQFLGQVAV